MTLKVKTLFPRCLTLFMSTLQYTTLLDVANFNVEIHNVDLTLSHVATWHQPKDNVEMFAGSLHKTIFTDLTFQYCTLSLVQSLEKILFFWLDRFLEFQHVCYCWFTKLILQKLILLEENAWGLELAHKNCIIVLSDTRTINNLLLYK